MPEVISKHVVGRLLELTAFNDKDDSGDVLIVLSDIAPIDVMSQLDSYSRDLSVTDIQKHAHALGQWLVGKGWGVAVEAEAHRFKVETLKVTDDDPWTVARYAPMCIDGKVYFAISVPGPAGNFRHEAAGFAVTYVDPLTGAEYYRATQDTLNRATYASAEKVQEVLEHLLPNAYQAVSVSFEGTVTSSITLVLKKTSYKPILRPRAPMQHFETELSTEDRKIIAKYHQRIDPNDRMGTVILAAHLLEAQTSSRFVRLAKVLSDTIWSV